MAILPEVKANYGRLKLFIDGEWVDSASTVFHETTNPATEEVIAEYPQATEQEAAGRGGSGAEGIQGAERNRPSRKG